jgi:hypothetical protein
MGAGMLLLLTPVKRHFVTVFLDAEITVVYEANKGFSQTRRMQDLKNL